MPELVQRSRDNARLAGVADRAEFRQQDLFKTDLSQATVITMYLLPEVNLQLRPRLLALEPGTRIVSHDWDLGDWPPDRTRVVEVPDKAVGLEKLSRLHLWTVPAAVPGRWCGTGTLLGLQLDIAQRYQQLQGRFSAGLAAFEARVLGRDIVSAQGLAWRVVDGPRPEQRELRVSRAEGPWSTLAGARFRRALASASGCGG